MLAPIFFKLLIVATAGGVGGELLFLLQSPAETAAAPFYEHPSVIAAAFGVISTVIVLVGNEMRARWKERKDVAMSDKERAHITTDKLTELNYNDRAKLDDTLERIFGQERTFLQNRIAILEESEYESRIQAHNSINEIQRFQNYLIQIHSICSKAGVELPEFKVKSYEELMHVTPQSVSDLKRMDAWRAAEITKHKDE